MLPGATPSIRRDEHPYGGVTWADATGKKHPPPPPPPLETGWVQCETSGASSSSRAVPSRARGSASSTGAARTAAARRCRTPTLRGGSVSTLPATRGSEANTEQSRPSLVSSFLAGGGGAAESPEPERLLEVPRCAFTRGSSVVVVAVSYLLVYSIMK